MPPRPETTEDRRETRTTAAPPLTDVQELWSGNDGIVEADIECLVHCRGCPCCETDERDCC